MPLILATATLFTSWRANNGRGGDKNVWKVGVPFLPRLWQNSLCTFNVSVSANPQKSTTGRPDRKWRESKQRLTWWPDLALLGCCLVSLHFVFDILSGRPVQLKRRKTGAAVHVYSEGRVQSCKRFMDFLRSTAQPNRKRPNQLPMINQWIMY